MRCSGSWRCRRSLKVRCLWQTLPSHWAMPRRALFIGPFSDGQTCRRPGGGSGTQAADCRACVLPSGSEVGFGELGQNRTGHALKVDVATVAEALEALGHIGQTGARSEEHTSELQSREN